MRRGQFLGMSGAMLAIALPPLTRRAAAADIVNYTLTSAPFTFAPVPGVGAYSSLAYNGSLPGPLLRATLGQRVRVRYVNRSGGDSTIHWHGMILPNAMDGVENVTQTPVKDGGEFVYEFVPNPAGTRWYHDHVSEGRVRGLFGMFIVDDPAEHRADAEFALVFHDVAKLPTFDTAMRGVSNAPMTDPASAPELLQMNPNDKMGDEVEYAAQCINGASYPGGAPLVVKVGQRVRLRVLNANPTQTRYVRLAGHRLQVTHADGNPLAQPLDVDALRVGVGERYDAWFAVTAPGAWLLQGLSSAPFAYQQAVVVHTEGMENATPAGSAQSLEGVDYFTYEKAGAAELAAASTASDVHASFVLDGGQYGSSRWTINGKTWPNTPKIFVHRDDDVLVHFTNKTDMDHPMHLHGHVIRLVEVDGQRLARPLAKDTSLVRGGGGTVSWRFKADSPKGRWLLHCHNDVHMMDGMMTEVVYRS